MFRARRPWLAAVLTAVAVAGCGPDLIDLLPPQGGAGGSVGGMSSTSAGAETGGNGSGNGGAAGNAGAELGGSSNPGMSGATFGGHNNGGFGGCTGFGCGGSDFGDGGGFDGPSCAEIFNNGNSCTVCGSGGGGGGGPTCPGRYKCNRAGFCMPSCNSAFDCSREKLEGFVCGADHTCTVCGISPPDTCRQQYGFDRPYCVKNRCEQCRTGDDCLDDDRALCIDNHCEPCAADAECPTGKCDRTSGRCIKP